MPENVITNPVPMTTLDDYVGLMIQVCEMTGNAVQGSFNEKNLTCGVMDTRDTVENRYFISSKAIQEEQK